MRAINSPLSPGRPGGGPGDKPEPRDRTLVGPAVLDRADQSPDRYVVKATERPAVLAWSTNDPDFDEFLELRATDIDGVSYLTAANGDGSYWIFRHEFIDDDTLVLVLPADDCLDAAI